MGKRLFLVWDSLTNKILHHGLSHMNKEFSPTKGDSAIVLCVCGEKKEEQRILRGFEKKTVENLFS